MMNHIDLIQELKDIYYRIERQIAEDYSGYPSIGCSVDTYDLEALIERLEAEELSNG